MNEPIADFATVKTRVVPVNPKPAVPQIIVQIMTVLVGLAALVLGLAAAGTFPLPAIVSAIASAVVAIGSLFGIVSPGLNKSAPKP